MKALTIHQPYAQYLIDGVKRFETRSWYTKHRGLVAIHAGKTWNWELHDEAERLSERYADVPDVGQQPVLGAMLGIALLDACLLVERVRDDIDQTERAIGNYRDGRFAWRMRVIERFETPIPASGQQGLWHWDWSEDHAKRRVAIVGSRNYPNLDLVAQYVKSLPVDTIVISGGAKGVDRAAEETARERGMTVFSLPVNTSKLPQRYEQRVEEYGRRARERNQHIVEMAGSVVAFWDEKSTGTKDTINKAKALNRPVTINPLEPQSQAVWVQKALDGFFNTYDEHAYIEKSKLKAEPSPDLSEHTWEKPWLIDEQHVWARTRENGEQTYHPVHIDSPEAQKVARRLAGIFCYSETMQLQDWLDNRAGWLATPNYKQQFDFEELPRQYLYESHYPVERRRVAVGDIQPTQATVYMPTVRSYIRSNKNEDRNGEIPFGIQFTDTKILLLNGHHRYAMQCWTGSHLVMEIETIPMTLNQAYGLLDEVDDSELIELTKQVLEEAMRIINKETIYA